MKDFNMKKNIKELTAQRKIGLFVLLALITVYLKNGFWLALFGLAANLLTDEILDALKVACALLFLGVGAFYGLVTFGVLA